MRPAVDRYYIRRQQAAKRKRAELWAAMRMLRRFTVHELMAVCENDNRWAVLAYVSLLRRSGFIVVVDQGDQARHVPKTHLIVRNTGPLPPASLARRRSMFDPNTDKEHPLER